MARENDRKAQPTNFDYLTGNLVCVSVNLPQEPTSATDNTTVDVDLGFPTGMEVQILGFGFIGATITNATLAAGSLGDSDGYLVAKTDIDAPVYFPCDGELANPETQSALVDHSIAQSIRVTSSISSGVWDTASILVWCVVTVAPTDSTTS